MKMIAILLFFISTSCTSLEIGSNSDENVPIDKEKIRKTVQDHLGEVLDCYKKVLNTGAKPEGKVVIKWTIGPGGRVLSDEVKSTTLNSSVVESCSLERLKTWTFPEPPAGQVADVSYPFVFNPN